MSRWEQVEKICQSALELEESQRKAFLQAACGGNEELRREVESLLKFDEHRDQFIEQPALEGNRRPFCDCLVPEKTGRPGPVPGVGGTAGARSGSGGSGC